MQKHKPHRYAKNQEQYEEEIGSYMSTPVHSVDAGASVQDVTAMMEEKNVGSLLVKDNDQYVGIVTERDITRKVVGKDMDVKTAKVSAIMSKPLFTMEGNRPITEANQYMAEHKIRHLAVTEDGKIVGMLSVKDLVSFFANPRLRH